MNDGTAHVRMIRRFRQEWVAVTRRHRRIDVPITLPGREGLVDRDVDQVRALLDAAAACRGWVGATRDLGPTDSAGNER